MAMAVHRGRVALALTFDYGQHAAAREIEASRIVSEHYGVKHRVITLPWVRDIPSGALVGQKSRPPQLTETELSDLGVTMRSARAVWVPNRNGIFLNVAAAFAEAAGGGTVIAGFNREEAETFPDNSKSFLDKVNDALAYSTLEQVRVASYTLEMNKKEILQAGLAYGIPLQAVWSCYLGDEKMCGCCESCRRLERAVAGTAAEKEVKASFQKSG
jgi:7-cyano-7-deazaguanine synthase